MGEPSAPREPLLAAVTFGVAFVWLDASYNTALGGSACRADGDAVTDVT